MKKIITLTLLQLANAETLYGAREKSNDYFACVQDATSQMLLLKTIKYQENKAEDRSRPSLTFKQGEKEYTIDFRDVGTVGQKLYAELKNLEIVRLSFQKL